jgi:hypothetical protein
MIGAKTAAALAAASSLLLGCAQSELPIQPLPPGPTAAEIADYARAQAQDRLGQADGNGDAVAQVDYTRRQISAEILSRQDPRLFDAHQVCERYLISVPRDLGGMPGAADPPFAAACRDIVWRYDDATAAIRGDLEARIVAADRAIIAQAEPRHP